MRRNICIGLAVLLPAIALVQSLVSHDSGSAQYHLSAMRHSNYPPLTDWHSYFRFRTWEWLAHGAPNRERHEKALIEMGFFQVKTFTLSNRTGSESDQDALFELYNLETFHDGCWTLAYQGSNFVRITASTNDMIIWERVIKEWDKPPTK